MATEEVKKDVKETQETATNEEGKGLLKIAEVRMLIYVVPVALVLLVLALILGK